MEKKLSRILDWLKKTHGLVCSDEKMGFGHVCATVFRAKKENQSLIVKIGLTDEAKKEVLMNRSGYDGIRELGAFEYIPNPCEFVEFENTPILILEDCGTNLFRTLQQAKNADEIFARFILELRQLYQSTMQEDAGQKGKEALLNAFNVLKEQFRNYLSVYEPFSLFELQFGIIEKKLAEIKIRNSCFACWDFTPEDMFVTIKGLKIIDPPAHVVGLPIIDLACFSGVSRDVYKLPGADKSYNLIRNLAFEIGVSLELGEVDIEFLFNFGRALQCSLSSRHRISVDSKLSKEYFEMAKIFLAKCVKA